jgi:multicomponent Na+:H+ antiporter subunit D
MIKIWNEVFWKDVPNNVRMLDDDVIPMKRQAILYAPVVFLTVLIIAAGVFAEPLSDLSRRAAVSILEPEPYQAAILHMEER